MACLASRRNSFTKFSVSVAAPSVDDGGPSEAEEKKKTFEQRGELQQIRAGMYLTDKVGARDEDQLHNAGVTHVLQCGHEFGEVPFPDTFKYFRVQVRLGKLGFPRAPPSRPRANAFGIKLSSNRLLNRL